MDSVARVRTKVAVFYCLMLALSAPFMALRFLSGHSDLLTLGLMWCPAFAAIATKLFFRESLWSLGWKWRGTPYQVLSYFLPILYALPVYLLVWLTGLGHFPSEDLVTRLRAEAVAAGTTDLSLWHILPVYIAKMATLGVAFGACFALGEEIGWRGFLVPELAKVTGLKQVALISGLMWAAWHYPLLIFGDYNKGTPGWLALPCFTALVLSVSFILAKIRLVSGSLWAAVIFHSSHNIFVQAVFTRLTSDTGPTNYIIDEFGIGLAMTSAIAAIIVYRRKAADAQPGVPADGLAPLGRR